MSNPENGWTWLDGATEEQMDSATNKAAIDRLVLEAQHLYQSIPDPRDERTCEHRDIALECAYEDGGDAAVDALKAKWKEQKETTFGQIEAIEELIAVRGARFKRPYEHWNEDEQRIRMMEEGNSSDY